jgi:RHS repeat-associated protein
MLAEYIYLGDQLLSIIKPGESVYYYHNDHLGTPQILTDDTGTIAWKAVYTPFGDAVTSIQTVENPFRFPGQYYDQETGLHYNYFRYYDPTTGRYITPDPIGLEGGINLFVYVASNPMNWIDPWGIWGVNVHSGTENPSFGTYVWARQIGIPDAEARLIAMGNNSTDNYAGWAIVLGTPGRHFDTAMGSVDSRDIFARLDLELAVELYKKGDQCGAFKTLGRGLHSIQDKVAHGSWPFYIPHPKWIDDPSERPFTLKETERQTKEYLKEFLRRINR